MKVLIIEDEPRSAQKIKGYLKELRPEWEIVAMLSGIKESMRYLREHPEPDLLFLDVQLSDGESLRIFDDVVLNSFVIFLTAYDKYALDAFELNSVDYVLKPFTREDVEKSLRKLDAFIYNKHGVRTTFERSDPKKHQRRFLVKKGKSWITLLSVDIAYMYKDEVLFLVDREGNRYLYDATLEEMEANLNPEKFFRINRQFIVSYDAIQNLKPASSNRLKLVLDPDPGEEVFVSQGKAGKLKKWLSF